MTTARLAKGHRKQVRMGRPGLVVRTYLVTFTDGVKTGQRLASTTVRKPVTRVIHLGTKVAPKRKPRPERSSSCDPHYSGCVPIASDVDCAGGSGNGPAYVSGPIRVIGDDIYRLDADHDGIACE